jgi:hypothetical protein
MQFATLGKISSHFAPEVAHILRLAFSRHSELVDLNRLCLFPQVSCSLSPSLGTSLANLRGNMKTLILSCLTVLGLTALVGCSDDERHTDTNSSYESATVDSKDMHHRHNDQDNH